MAYISAGLRRLVLARARHVCEYCLIHEEDTYLGCHVDHIISEKHGGKTKAENLAYACAACNTYKGSDIASITKAGVLTRFYNPRVDIWLEHFCIVGSTIQPLSDIGEVTALILQFNTENRLLEREELIAVGDYPGYKAT